MRNALAQSARGLTLHRAGAALPRLPASAACPLAAPVALSPTGHILGLPPMRPTFSWNAVAGAELYIVVMAPTKLLATVPNPIQLVGTTAGTSLVLPFDLPHDGAYTDYAWAVAAASAACGVGSFSTPIFFTAGPTTLCGTPGPLLAPGYRSTAGSSPLFAWGEGLYTTLYHVQANAPDGSLQQAVVGGPRYTFPANVNQVGSQLWTVTSWNSTCGLSFDNDGLFNVDAAAAATGQAVDSTLSDGPSVADLFSANATASGGNLRLNLRFSGAFDSSAAYATVALDTDENVATGYPGVHPAAGDADSGIIGTDFLIQISSGCLGATAQFLAHTGPPLNTFTEVGTAPVSFLLGRGMDLDIPLTLLGNDDGKLRFKAASWTTNSDCTLAAVRDALPNTGLAATLVTDIGEPALLAPVLGAAIPQNSPAIGCPWNSSSGFGFQTVFRWTESASSKGIADYQFVVSNAKINPDGPVVDTFVSSPAVKLTFCNAFVVDAELQGWEWRVRARDTLGAFGPWSETGRFQFAPCRINDAVCSSSPL